MSVSKKLAAAVAAGVATAGLAIVFTAAPAHACKDTVTNSVYGTGNDCIVSVTVAPLGNLEAGAGDGTADGGQELGEVYVVAAHAGGLGYIGVSNYETTGEGLTCGTSPGNDGPEGGAGTNSGGCYGNDNTYVDLRGGEVLTVSGMPIGPQTCSVNAALCGGVANLVPLPVSGQGTGPWNNSTRDGARDDGTNDLFDALCTLGVTTACSL